MRLRVELSTAPRVLARIDEIAAETGIKAKTLRNLHYGATRSMDLPNIRKLERWFDTRAETSDR